MLLVLGVRVLPVIYVMVRAESWSKHITGNAPLFSYGLVTPAVLLLLLLGAQQCYCCYCCCSAVSAAVFAAASAAVAAAGTAAERQ